MSVTRTMDKKTAMGVKYPNQICSFKRKTIVLSVDSQLGLADEKRGESPLQMHAGWSRLIFSLIDKRDKNGVLVLTGNIPSTDITAITHKIKLVYDDKFLNRNRILAKIDAEKKNAGGNNAALACSETFKTGQLKGKTPAEVITSGANGESMVTKQIAFLEEHLKEYPANKKLIDACKAAIIAYKDGSLKSQSPGAKSVTVREIYRTPLKFLASKKNEEGKFFVYRMLIECDYTRDSFPWIITLVNGWSEVTKQEDGTTQVSENISGRVSSTINLSDDEILHLMGRMDRTLLGFELTNFKYQLNTVELINSVLHRERHNTEENS